MSREKIKGRFTLKDGKLVLKPDSPNTGDLIMWFWAGSNTWSGLTVDAGHLIFAKTDPEENRFELSAVSDPNFSVDGSSVLSDLVRAAAEKIISRISPKELDVEKLLSILKAMGGAKPEEDEG